MARASSGVVVMHEEDVDGFEGELSPSLQNLVAQDSLKWIFVGGKGGVGKTTTSCCLAVQLAKVRESVLVISTDPAHNLSDAFGQKFSREPTKVDGFDNLACMEIDPQAALEDFQKSMEAASGLQGLGGAGGAGDGADPMAGMPGMVQGLFQDLSKSIPGIDEAVGFAEMMRTVVKMDYSCIVFDTAPTGHTLRLLTFPDLIANAIQKLEGFKSRFGGLFSMAESLFGGASAGGSSGAGASAGASTSASLASMKTLVDRVLAQFRDPTQTTFVCVCIPEFLSLFETERLVQELAKHDIDCHNIVVNQVVYPYAEPHCRLCEARHRMQKKYIDQIGDLYEDFHVVRMPLLDEEVRGLAKLEGFGHFLLHPYDPVRDGGRGVRLGDAAAGDRGSGGESGGGGGGGGGGR